MRSLYRAFSLTVACLILAVASQPAEAQLLRRLFNGPTVTKTYSVPVQSAQVCENGVCTPATVVESKVVESKVVAPKAAVAPSTDEQDIKKQLLEATRQARLSNDITEAEAFKLQLAAQSPAVIKAVKDGLTEHSKSEGMQAIDWKSALTKFKELLPVILQLIDAFTTTPPTPIGK